MFGTIRNWFYRNILNKHRLLFRYWNGSRFVHEDPFVLMRRLLTKEDFDVDTELKRLEIPDPKKVIETLQHIANAVRKIFEIPDFPDGGLSELECVNLLKTFVDWADQLKKNGVTKQISPTSSPVVVSSNDLAKRRGTKEPSDSTVTESES